MSVIPPEKYVYYFCDESSQISDRFMAVGGLAVPDTVLPQMRADLIKLRQDNGNPKEVKWSKTKERRDSPERAFADYFERAVKAKQVHFHIRFAPFDEYDHTISGPNLRSDTTSKMHFQLLLHRALRFYGRHYALRVTADGGDCTKALPTKLDSLHWQASGLFNTSMDCVESIRCVDSEREPMLQLLDVPLGALTALRNERVLGPAKQSLAEYVSAKWPTLDIAKNTPLNRMDFSVWNVKPKQKRRDPWS